MIQETIIRHIEEKTGIKTAGELYKGAPAEIVIVTLVGADRENLIDTVQVRMDCYGESTAQAARNNLKVMQAMDSLPELETVSASDRMTYYPVADTTTKRYRWQSIYNVTHYEEG